MKSPTGGRNQVTRQTRRAVYRTQGTSQDCTRVFPVKGAANALCNPETNVRGGSGSWAAGHAGLRGNPSFDAPESLGPPLPLPPQASKTSGQKVFPRSATREAVSCTGALPGLHFVEDIGNRGKSRREVRGAKQRRNREVPGFSEARHARGNPDIGRAATGSRGRRRSRRGVGVEVRTTRIGGPRGEEEATLLKLRRDRRELSDRGADRHVAKPDPPHSNRQGRDLPSGRELPRTCCKPCRDPITVCEDGAGEPRGKVGKKCRESMHDGLVVSQAPAPGTRQASRCKQRCRGRVGSPKIAETD